MKKNKMRMMLGLVVMLGVLMMFAGCESGGDQGDTTVDVSATLYFVDSQYVETGDESLEPMVEVPTTLKAETDDLDSLYEDVLELLVTPTVDGTETMIEEGMIDDVKIEGDRVTIDFDGDKMHGGSFEETYLIEQVVRTMTTSYEEIKRVAFTVEGKTVESLMGHLQGDCDYGIVTVQDEERGEIPIVSVLEEGK